MGRARHRAVGRQPADPPARRIHRPRVSFPLGPGGEKATDRSLQTFRMTDVRNTRPADMKTYFGLLLWGGLLLSGCYRGGHLYPVQGPLARQTAPPVYRATMHGVLNSGGLTITLPDGEICQGRWAVM